MLIKTFCKSESICNYIIRKNICSTVAIEALLQKIVIFIVTDELNGIGICIWSCTLYIQVHQKHRWAPGHIRTECKKLQNYYKRHISTNTSTNFQNLFETDTLGNVPLALLHIVTEKSKTRQSQVFLEVPSSHYSTESAQKVPYYI